MGHRLLGFGITLIMDYMDNRYKSCDYGRFFGFKITTSKKQKVLFDYANTTPVEVPYFQTTPFRFHRGV